MKTRLTFKNKTNKIYVPDLASLELQALAQREINKFLSKNIINKHAKAYFLFDSRYNTFDIIVEK